MIPLLLHASLFHLVSGKSMGLLQSVLQLSSILQPWWVHSIFRSPKGQFADILISLAGIRKEGVQLVELCTAEWLAIKTKEMCLSQSHQWSAVTRASCCCMVKLNCPAKPSLWRRNDMVRVFCMPNRSQRTLKSLDSKSRPWSLWIMSGAPNRLNMPSINASATVSASWSGKP